MTQMIVAQTHRLALEDGKALLVTVCTNCEAGDPTLRRITTASFRSTVLLGRHRTDECHHPDHGQKPPKGAVFARARARR